MLSLPLEWSATEAEARIRAALHDRDEEITCTSLPFAVAHKLSFTFRQKPSVSRFGAQPLPPATHSRPRPPKGGEDRSRAELVTEACGAAGAGGVAGLNGGAAARRVPIMWVQRRDAVVAVCAPDEDSETE